MLVRSIGFKAAAAAAIGMTLVGTAGAQESKFTIPTQLSYQSSSKQMWNTVLIVSAVVLAVGLLQDDTTLAILGGAGVLVSLTQVNKYGFQLQSHPRGLDLVKSGPLSFGVNPFGQIGLRDGFGPIKPSVYLSANFKF
jgi:hypothetical protein